MIWVNKRRQPLSNRKLRLLLDRDLGLEIGTGADDMISLRQVAELIERLVRRVG